jgi:hypothetical protein
MPNGILSLDVSHHPLYIDIAFPPIPYSSLTNVFPHSTVRAQAFFTNIRHKSRLNGNFVLVQRDGDHVRGDSPSSSCDSRERVGYTVDVSVYRLSVAIVISRGVGGEVGTLIQAKCRSIGHAFVLQGAQSEVERSSRDEHCKVINDIASSAEIQI